MDKKAEELRQFNAFRSRAPDFPTGEAIPGEAPDFVVCCDGTRTGIEVTEVFKPDTDEERAQEGERAALLSKLRDTVEEDGPTNLSVYATFHPAFPIRKHRRGEIVEAAAKTIMENYLDAQPYIRVHRSTHRPLLPREFQSVLIVNLPGETGGVWHLNGGGFLLTEPDDVVQGAIESKRPKLQQYLQRCDECWLLVVAGTRPTGFIDTKAAADALYDSPFARTFLMDDQRYDVHELRGHPVV